MNLCTTAGTRTAFPFFLLVFLNLTTYVNGQNVGIGTTNPLARFHVADSSVLFFATGDAIITPGNPPVSGPGRRMMWYPDKVAFRAGYVDASQWDKVNMGYYSFASGYNSIASGGFSTAMGGGTTSSGAYSTATGYSTTASGFGSSSFGYRTVAKAYGSISLGLLNDDLDNPDPFNPAALDRIFQIGNGNVNSFAKANALTVLRNGNIGIAMVSPTEKLHLGADARLRIEGSSTATDYPPALSIGGYGALSVDAPGIAGGRFIVTQGGVGIGAPVPGFPLNFANSLGDKISLWGSLGNHYGFGIQSSLLQIYTDGTAADIAFGYGSSSSFIENLRIKGNGVMQFPASLSKKIILYPGGTGDASLSVFGNELRVASDYNGADITFGYDNRISGFTEKYRMKANGALSVNGNTGSTGQVLQSNGSGASPGWVNPTNLLFNNMYGFYQSSAVVVTNGSSAVVPGLAGTINVTTVSKVMLSFYAYGNSLSCSFCGGSSIGAFVELTHNSNSSFNWYPEVAYATVANGWVTEIGNGFFIGTLQPGTYTLVTRIQNSGPTAQVYSGQISIVVVPQ